MEGKELFCKERIQIHLEADDREDALRKTAALMQKTGIVKEDFLKNILAREKKFPTGLKIGEIGIAIPHTDPEYVNEAGIAVSTMKDPVKFQRMDDPEEMVEAKVIFMLALKDGHNHLTMISSIVKMLSNKEVLNKLIQADSEETILDTINSNL